MPKWSSTGGSAADQCGSPSPLLLVPGTPSAGRSTEEIWKDINLSFLKEQDHHRRGHLSAAANCLGGFPGSVLCDGFSGLNREKQGRNKGPSPVSLSLGSPAASPDPATCLSLYWTPTDSSHQLQNPPKPVDKRGPKNPSATDSEDKRRKRLMKNRESADRSRARKQVSRSPAILFPPESSHLSLLFLRFHSLFH